MEILTADRAVDITAEAAAKSGDSGQVLESVFSAAALPVNFFRDLLKGHSAKAMSLNRIPLVWLNVTLHYFFLLLNNFKFITIINN